MGRKIKIIEVKCKQDGIAGVLQSNLYRLMIAKGWGRTDIENLKKQGRVDVGGRFVSQLIEGERGFPKIDALEQIAKCFGLKAWQLLRPTLLDELPDGRVENLIDDYLAATSEGRDLISQTAGVVAKKPS